MAKPFRYNKIDKGFTLLEVMIAVLLLSLSYVAVLESFSSSMQRLLKLEDRLEYFYSQDSQLNKIIKYSGPAIDLEENEGEVFLEGATYQLSVIDSESGLLQSLQLQQK